MFADPQSVTISGSAKSLARVAAGDGYGRFANDDGSVVETVTQQLGKRARRRFRLSYSKVATDPLIPTQNAPYSMSVELLVDVPLVGFTVADQKAVVDGLIAQLNASSGAAITKLLGGEN